MSGNSLSSAVDGKVFADKFLKFLRDIGVHAVIHVPRRLGGIKIESGACAKIISCHPPLRCLHFWDWYLGRSKSCRFVRHVSAPRPLTVKFSSVQVNPDRNHKTGRFPFEAADGRYTENCMGVLVCLRMVAIHPLYAAETAVLTDGFHSHRPLRRIRLRCGLISQHASGQTPH